jgi:hypothetical protein
LKIEFNVRRLILAQHKVDYRKQLNGLLGEAYNLGFDPYQGDCVVFVKTDKTQLRILYGDSLGLYLVSRRFDGGRLSFIWKFLKDPTASCITEEEVYRLLQGESVIVKKVKSIKLGLHNQTIRCQSDCQI